MAELSNKSLLYAWLFITKITGLNGTSWVGTIAVAFFNLQIQTWTKLSKAKQRQNRQSVTTVLILNPPLLYSLGNTRCKTLLWNNSLWVCHKVSKNATTRLHSLIQMLSSASFIIQEFFNITLTKYLTSRTSLKQSKIPSSP